MSNILSDERTEEYTYGLISKDFMRKNCAALEGYFSCLWISSEDGILRKTIVQIENS
ncbi:hypothetical protein [Arenibacter sp. ARW7G5Y1]|uniref:hypothetical protein n=1 Tax=Arenibacter sp. ARW7G5Y1 TaxID=2135619 RepID=UPI000D8CF2A4|nr:hypothetical protein [Arenibacter sp. ARW7G5Y1]PXX31174.1 hypothetical protein C7972_1019 [Arenibacter sp. ARW7G5Y1]